MRISRRRALLGTVGLLAGSQLAVAPTVAAPTASDDLTDVYRVELPRKRLRGFGAVAGVFESGGIAGSEASVMRIECESDAKAALLQAKLLSDMTALPGTRPTVLHSAGGLEVPVLEAVGQGFLIAARRGSTVTTLTALTTETLTKLAQARIGERAGDYAYKSDAVVPMFLDRWDRHGFLFYSYTWQRPHAGYVPPAGFEGRPGGYDFAEQFRWAKAHGVGFVFWDTEAQNDTAEGLMNDPWIDWAVQGANAASVPIHMNISASPPTWLLNRYRAETQKMPLYSGGLFGPGDPETGGQGMLPWNSDASGDAEMAMMQSTVRKYAGLPTVVGWLEPHGETVQSPEDFMLDYGPAADRRFQQYLRETYGSVGKVNARWYGDERRLRSWDDVRVPEMASFVGWGPAAFDLTGEWRIGYEPNADGSPYDTHNLNGGNRGHGQKSPSSAAPADWFTPGFDDSGWGALRLPGNDRILFTPIHPAVLRRRFSLPADWHWAQKRVWLYVWDLKFADGEKTLAYLNGVKVGEYTPQRGRLNYGVFEVTAALRDGENLLALRLPQGGLDYRVYLSPHPPTQYPAGTTEENARWVDFADWQAWSRAQAARRSVEMIREVDPDRSMTQMAPNYYADVLKPVLEECGGQFHDTGYMGGFYADLIPNLSRGSNLPFDVEPGGPARDPIEFQHMMGLYLTEGVQGVSYFIDIGDVMCDAPIRAVFETYLPVYQMIGKYHLPKAELAVLYDDRVERLLSGPWGNDLNVTTAGGYWPANLAAPLGLLFPYDGLTGPDFARGHAARYRAIVDTNSSLMDEARITEIEAYVRGGGMFLTFHQTGRHSTTQNDAWPISRLTGYGVTRISPYDADGHVAQNDWRRVHPAPGQAVFTDANWSTDQRANGLTLKRIADDAEDLLLWEDGSVAVGMRRIGQGVIVHVGAKFSGARMFDRVNEPGVRSPETRALQLLYATLLDWRGLPRLPAQAHSDRNAALLRHYVSNSGLHDVWVVWNQEREKALTVDVEFAPNFNPATATDVGTGEIVPIERGPAGSRISGLTLAPMETRMLLSPRGRISEAARDWFELQRGWWQGATPPNRKPLPTPEDFQTHTLPLTANWRFQPIDGKTEAEIAAIVAVRVDDLNWERRDFGVWSLPDHGEVGHGVLRRSFTVPARWKGGTVGLWMQSWNDTTFLDQGRVYLDGKTVRDFRADGITGDTLDGVLTPGSSHQLAVEIKSGQSMAGARGNVWLTWWPEPAATMDLSGEWIPSHDGLNHDAPITLPGPWNTMMAGRGVTIPAEHERRNVMLAVTQEGRVTGAIVNGKYLRRHHHAIGPRTDLNITPFVRFGEANEIILVWGNSVGSGRVERVVLEFFDAGVWP